MVRTLSHVFFLDPSPVRRVPIQTGIQRKLNFVSVRTIKGGSSGLVARADELRGRRKLCQLQCPCVEFVLDSHALELRVLGLTSVWKTVLAEPFWKVRQTCPFKRRRNDALTTNPVHELHVDNCGLSPDGIADAMEAAEADPPLVILLPESIAAQAAYAEALLPGSAPACHKHTRNPGRSEQEKP